MGPLLPQLVASVTWDLCRLSWSLQLRGTFVALISCFHYVGPWSHSLRGPWTPQLDASVTWDLDRLRYGAVVASAMGSWSSPLRGILIASAMSPPLRPSLPNKSSLRARTCIASRRTYTDSIVAMRWRARDITFVIGRLRHNARTSLDIVKA